MLPFYCNVIIVWSLEIFSVVSQAFNSMLANRGTVLVHGCIGYHFDGLLSQLLVALRPFSFVYCYVINQRGRLLWLSRGDITECIVCVLGYDPLTFSFLSFLFFDWVGVLWPQLFLASEDIKQKQNERTNKRGIEIFNGSKNKCKRSCVPFLILD